MRIRRLRPTGTTSIAPLLVVPALWYILSFSAVPVVVFVDGLAVPSKATEKKQRRWIQDLQIGYQRRCSADPQFGAKSAMEVVLAATTQLTAELERRGGVKQVLTQVDFVLAGVLTAMYGKYASMWKVAPTTTANATTISNKDSNHDDDTGGIKVPTNAFQRYLLDGVTPPTLSQRLGSFLIPIPALFRAGVAASLVGYGFMAILITLRFILIPSYIPATRTVNILYASLYTGCFMAVVSNIRYQILQGVVEPTITQIFGRFAVLQTILIFLVRIANGIVGSMLAISGMRWLGLQKLR